MADAETVSGATPSLPRYLLPRVLEALADTPIVYLVGPRQSGKTTLARQLPAQGHDARYLTFDDLDVLAAARADPVGFVDGLAGPAALDEVQRVPEIALAIKASVDRDRRPGRFFLTGSADVLALPQVATALVGRMEVLTLRPFAQCELLGRSGDWVDRLFASEPFEDVSTATPSELWDRILAGGFPEVVARTRPERRDAWLDAYVTTLLVREVAELATLDRLDTLPRLLRLVATRAGSLLNVSELSRATELPLTSLRRYLTLLETTFALTLLPPWTASSLGKRLVKAPKLHLADTGLLAHLLGASAGAMPATMPGHLRGPLFEGFVVQEVAKLASWSRARPRLYHFRSHGRDEVDLVLEDATGRIVGIEARAGATTTSSDFAGLRALRRLAGDRWVRGVVVHGGSRAVPFEADLQTFPAANL